MSNFHPLEVDDFENDIHKIKKVRECCFRLYRCTFFYTFMFSTYVPNQNVILNSNYIDFDN